MSIVLQGSTSGSVTLQEPAVAGTTVLDLPATSGTILTTGSPQSGGIIQVVQGTTATQISSISSTYADTGITASITPKFSTSKVLILITISGIGKDSSDTAINLRIQKNSANLISFNINSIGYSANSSASFPGSAAFNYLDSPATTSATTYKVQFASQANTSNTYLQLNSGTSTITLMEVAA